MVRIVFNKLLGGWLVVRGPHQTPLSGVFPTKAAAKQSLIDAAAARDARGPLAAMAARKAAEDAAWRDK